MFDHSSWAGRQHENSGGGASQSDVDTIMRALGGKRVGKTTMAHCPAHYDRNPSLAIKLEGGKILVHCFAGCKQPDVIAALRSLGLWPESKPMDTKPRRRIVATYDYVDEHGEVLYQSVRFEPKDFRQRRPDGNGGWIWKSVRDEQKVLYRLPEIIEAPIVFVVEGERDVESLREYGFVATTNVGGANKPWLPQYTEALVGREVILIGDNDDAGRKHITMLKRALLGKVTKLVHVTLDDRVKDVTEWFDAGHSELELIELVEHPEEGVR